ncbi:MAG: LEA14-like dessication related protein [Saprospiraceae bacterium]|jgi:LEA14-like dessication related protein
MKHILSLIFLSFLIFSSCSTSILEPTIEKIEDVDIIEMSKSRLELNAFMVLKNPNGFSLDLARANMKAFVDDIELATIDQTFDTPMPANENFKMPITIKMDLDKLYRENPIAAIGKGLQIMSDKKLMVKFIGTIDVGKGMAKVSVPINQEEMVLF